MTRRLLALVVALFLTALPGAARAQGGMQDEVNPAQTARALTLQTLALLEQGRGHEEAVAKLDQALAAGDKRGVDLRALRAAHLALHREDTAQAQRLLEHAFPGKGNHAVGVTFRPAIGSAQVGAGIAGVVLAAVAALGLLHRRRVDRR